MFCKMLILPTKPFQNFLRVHVIVQSNPKIIIEFNGHQCTQNFGYFDAVSSN